MINQRMIAVVNILLGNRPGPVFETINRQYCLQNENYYMETSNGLKYLEYTGNSYKL